jgi:hypothetical protein
MRRYLSKLPRSTEELLRWHEKYVSPLSLLVGFTLDSLALKRVDLFWGNVLLFSYLAIAAVGIVVFHLIQSGRWKGKVFLKIVPFIPAAIQFGFGGLFSGFVILYSHSAAYATSWIFVILLACLLIGNERFRQYYTRFAFQASVLFVALLTFLIFFLPVVTGKIGTAMFLISEATAIGITVAFVRAFSLAAPEVFRDAKWTLRKSIASIFVIFNILYFTNTIPPLPLSLKAAGVYHDVRRAGDVYQLEAEPLKWYQNYLNYNTTFHRAPNERIYVFTAVFAPTKLATTIEHHWQRHDEEHGWEEVSSVGFAIQGGRDGGYRGYTVLDNAEPGKWRVNVESGGKLVGRVSFEVLNVEEKVQTNIEEY